MCWNGIVIRKKQQARDAPDPPPEKKRENAQESAHKSHRENGDACAHGTLRKKCIKGALKKNHSAAKDNPARAQPNKK